MMNAYDKLYIEDAADNLAVCMDYGSMLAGTPDLFFDRFIVSGISRQFERGNPKYLAGMSGVELEEAVLMETGAVKRHLEYRPDGKSPEYWCGWALAHLQWETALPFAELKRRGVSIRLLESMYPTYHEADISKFMETSMRIMKRTCEKETAPLKRQRKLAGLTQKELAERSGIKLRMIQAYEQNCQPIARAEAGSVLKLAGVLGCETDRLLP